MKRDEFQDPGTRKTDADAVADFQRQETEIASELARIRANRERDEHFAREVENGLCPILSQRCLNLKEGERLEEHMSAQFEQYGRDIARLEAKLAKHPCIGDLQQWERNYRFSRKPAFLFPHSINPDLDVIELHLRRVGTVSILPTRNVMVPAPAGDWPDSRPIQSIDGRFTLSSGALALKRCQAAAGR